MHVLFHLRGGVNVISNSNPISSKSAMSRLIFIMFDILDF
jgi:hypothetical protein